MLGTSKHIGHGFSAQNVVHNKTIAQDLPLAIMYQSVICAHTKQQSARA